MQKTYAPPLVTLHREIAADLDTPVSVFLRLKDHGPSFLLESVTGGEQVARYSFIGVNPGQVFVLRGKLMEVLTAEGRSTVTAAPDQDPLDLLRDVLGPFNEAEHINGLPRFFGGLVGYLGYDLIRFFEPTVSQTEHPEFPDSIFFHADSLVAFDHAFDRLLLIASAPDNDAAHKRLDTLEALLTNPIPKKREKLAEQDHYELASNQSREEFIRAVETIQEHIAAGDIFQCVLSQRFSRKTKADPFDIYRALRRLNPSPSMFYFDFGRLATNEPLRLIGASPEMHVRLENRTAAVRPIAGTRPRGDNPNEDAEMENDLLADPKERAEHLMLIDLARNDLGRVCRYGTVQVTEQFIIERYSHVMHIVSHTEGELRPEFDAFDLMKATFPAGTVSGAPKIRAMQIIEALEPDARGPYAGAVGYFGYGGNADTCIALRTLVMHGDTIHIQAGAGIVADSDANNEFQETLNKAKALSVAVQNAENPSDTRQTRIYDPGD